MEHLTHPSHDGFPLSVDLFPVERPRAVVQLIHGAKEHKERYHPFIAYLNEHGYAAVIADNRGHGASVSDRWPLSFIDDFRLLPEDQYAVTCLVRQRFPGVPLAVLGHSLGSMIARIYLQRHDDEPQALILSGTANFIPAGIVGIAAANMVCALRGERVYSRLLERMANFLDDSWVVGDAEALAAYRADPLCTYPYPAASMREIFRIDRELHAYDRVAVKTPELPILSISGALDPVTGGERGLADTERTLRRLGYSDLTFTVYPGMYHEVLNETGRAEVWQDVLTFLDCHFAP